MDLSPGFIGQGIIIGPAIALHMLLGSIVGWGILSPYAKRKGWAPGEVDDWETGSRGWIIWISLASLFADASVKFVWFLIRPLWTSCIASRRGKAGSKAVSGTERLHPPSEAYEDSSVPLLDDMHPDSETTGRVPEPNRSHPAGLDASRDASNKNFIRNVPASRYLAAGFVLSVIVCTVVIHFVFGTFIPWYYTLLGIGLSLPMAVVGIRSIAETDYNPESALGMFSFKYNDILRCLQKCKVSQLAFAALVSHSNPNAVIINLISAAIAQAGANQSGDLAYDLKVGSLVGSRPKAQVQGQIIGSVFGALISCGMYKVYALHYPIPGPLFTVPSSYLVLSTARLVLGRGLPEGVAPFALGAAIISMLVTMFKMRCASRWWQDFIPSGVAFAIGMSLHPPCAPYP